jgi:hypothetical protein
MQGAHALFHRSPDFPLGESLRDVMAGFVPAIHALLQGHRTWMPGTSPGMTSSTRGR